MISSLNGYMGKVLVVDLAKGLIEDQVLDAEVAWQFIGGSGLAARYLYDQVRADTNPLGAENPLIFMAGPLTGTPAPSCGRHVVCARSPATGLWGEANSGGRFGAEMRFAGYDGILIKGQADAPTYLSLVEGEAQLHDAAHLWGKDTYQTQTLIKEELGGSNKMSVACIGPAGENLVRFAAVMNDEGRAAGRTGLGAVMGSKKLKGVAVYGSKAVPLADRGTFREALRRALLTLKDDFTVDMFRDTGTAGAVEYNMMMGNMPSRYFSQGLFQEAENLSGGAMIETILIKNGACYRCPIACWRVTEVTKGPYKQSPIHGPEYESVAALGSLILSDNLEGVAYANHLCNAYGLDTISAGSTIALACYLYERGIIGEKDTGGLSLRWGDIEAVIKLVEMIARREGFGALLAEGSHRVAQHLGVEDTAVQVNGLEVPMHDPRAITGMALIYATSPRGACHNQGDMYFVDFGRSVDALAIEYTDRFASVGKAATAAHLQDWRSVYNALVMCIFCNPEPEDTTALLSAATGWEYSLDDLMTTGERIWNLKRAFNNRLGLSSANDKLPRLLLQPLSEGGTEGNVPELELMLQEYYQYRNWDPVTGKPTNDKLLALGLKDVAEDLWG
ncbi:MAG: aldehyde ferredoxin oxidoreductase family protein [Anaerolineae bacterium]